jgi:hypothetical protein
MLCALSPSRLKNIKVLSSQKLFCAVFGTKNPIDFATVKLDETAAKSRWAAFAGTARKRGYRKRLSLSQDEVAYLLGNESGAKVCRYECFLREPAFRAALAYELIELIFQKSGQELFAGSYDRIGKEVAARAGTLMRQLDGSVATRRNARKKEALEGIISLFGKK